MLGGFVIGCMVGCFCGVFVACLLVAAKSNSAPLLIRENMEAPGRVTPRGHRQGGEQNLLFSVSMKPIDSGLREHLRNILREIATNLSILLLGIWVGPSHHPDMEDRVRAGNLRTGALIEMIDGIPFFLDSSLAQDQIRVVIGVDKKETINLSRDELPRGEIVLQAERA